MRIKKAKVYGEVYGCPSNIADSEIALGLLKQAGFEVVEDKTNSDLNIIFTCNVKTPTSHRMMHRIRELTKLGKPLIVGGCMSKTERKIIGKINPEASLLGPDSIHSIVDVVRAALEGKKVVALEDLRKIKLCLPRIRKKSKIGIVPISIGCNLNCSYCCVKFARGKLFCYPPKEIVDEVKKAVKDGCNEIWLTSQDNGSFDFNGIKLPQLLKKVCKIQGNFKIRVGMMNPVHVKPILDDLIEAYKNEKIQKFLHLPIQSGSNRILKLMRRGYTVEDFVQIVERFRNEISGLFLSTDVIAGFPWEREEDFNRTIKLLERIKPDKVNISKFGARPGTKAAEMEQLPIKVVKRRSKLLHNLVKELKKGKNSKTK